MRKTKITVPAKNHIKKKIKYIGIKLTKEVKDIDSENYKTLMREIEDDKELERCPVIMRWSN